MQAMQRSESLALGPTLAADKLHRLIAYMGELGLTVEPLLHQAELNATVAVGSTVNVRNFSRFYQLCMQELERRGIAVSWSAGIGTQLFTVLGHCISTADTLWEAMARAAQLSALLDHRHDRLRLEVDHCSASLLHLTDWHRRDSFVRPSRYSNDNQFVVRSLASNLLTWHRFFCWLIGRHILVEELQLGCPADPDYHTRLSSHFQCENIRYDFQHSRLRFDRHFLDCRIVQDQASIEAFVRDAPYHLMVNEPQATDTLGALRALLGSRYRDGLPTFEEAATMMGMSASTLRRELMRENITYQDVKDECRKQKAIALLCESNLSIGNISRELGFVEPASFTRSFKNWSQMSPFQYRMLHRQRPG